MKKDEIMKRNKNKKNWKTVVIMILVCSLLVGSVAGAVLLFHQGGTEINDYTENSNMEEETSGTDDEPEAILSSNVKMLTGDKANEINNAIKTIQNTNQGMIMEIDSNTQFAELGIGDIFYLEGSETTPFRETYIGKIKSADQKGETTTYVIETPMVDEVFDVLKFDYEEVLTAENISDIETVPGVTVKHMGVDITETGTISPENQSYTFSTLSAPKVSGEDNIEWVEYGENTEKLLFEYELDLFEVFGLKSDDDIEFQEKCNATEGSRVKVYTTVTGMCYHRSTCPCVGRSKVEMTLIEAEQEGYSPCYLCNPPLLVDKGVSNLNESLNLVGRMGLDEIDFSMDYEWDILNGEGLEELYISAKGEFITEASLEAKLKYELEGRTTTITLPCNAAEVQGLKEKLFPLAFISYNGSFQFSGPGNENIRKMTGSVPATIAIILYVDISGNVSICGTMTFNYTQSFDYSNQVVKDGEWVLEQEVNTKEEKNVKLEVEAKADADAHLGVSLGLYVFNLNVVELAIGKIGGSIEGTVKMNYENNAENESDNLIDASYYMRLYYKVLELDIKLKCKARVLGLIEGSAEVDYTWVYLDRTIKEWGTKRSTRFKEGIMSFSVLTAQDEDAIYYKNEKGQLVREENGFKKVIYNESISFDKDFFSICGIDESFIYLMIPNENDVYDIYRVAKDGSISKKVLSDIVNCLCVDEECLYYITEFDESNIYKLNRETLKEEKFADFDENVKFMREQDENFYVVTREDNIFASLFGADSSCYLINKQGIVLGDYGTDPEIQNYYLVSGREFYIAIRQTSSGYLRDVADDIYWMAKDKETTILTEQISGWMYDDIGIFTTLNNDKENSTSYKIVLYRASDGSCIDVTEVNSDQAFFTLCQSETDTWYFFDQTDQELILYRMDSDFNNKQLVKSFSKEELPCNLESCSMIIMENRIYFYSMSNDTTSEMLYRYDVF